MRLPKRLSDAVMLARWCERERKDVAAVARLIVLAHRAFRAGEAACNAPDLRQREQKTADEFTRAALDLGYYGVSWPGLWPVLRTEDGRDVDLPAL